jgi:D-alanyl-D-alanine carboxypeptidase
VRRPMRSRALPYAARVSLPRWCLAAWLCAGCGDDGSGVGDAQTGTGPSATGPAEDTGTSSSGSGPADDSEGSTARASSSEDTASSTGDEAAHCDDARAIVEAAAAEYARGRKLVGLAVAFATEACDPWTGAWGLADTSTGRALTAEHVLRAGSVTKSYTAALVLKLAEDDLLALDDTLQSWGVDVPSADAITLRQLLNHTSGLADYQNNATFQAGVTADPDRVWTPQELVDFSVELGPVGVPGEAHVYSNANYVIAALIAEAAARSSYAQALRERVLAPIGLQHTFVEGHERWPDPTATGYLATVDARAPADTTGLYDASQVWSAGAIVGTADDVRTWISALLGSDFLEPDSQSELVTFVPADGADYGLGVFRIESDGVVAFGHNGAVMGFQAAAFVHPDSGTSVAVLHNQVTLTAAGGLASDPTSLALEILAAVADVQ